MSRYPSEDVRRFDQQFAETPAERSERRVSREREGWLQLVERAIQDERHRCATIARQWIKGAPTTTTETVVGAIVEAIERGDVP